MKVTHPRLARLVERWRRMVRNEQILLSILAAITGAVVAYGTLAFRWLIDAVQNLAYGAPPGHLSSVAENLPWWQVLLIPSLGGLIIGLFIKYLMPGERLVGVAHVIEASTLRGGRMSLNQGLAAAAVSAASLGVGASAGREGPMVHFGAALASYVARRAHLSPSLSLTLLGCGVAAGVAASFNAPIAGVFFALEVVIGHYALHAFSPIVIASVIGTIVSRAHLGDSPAFVVLNHGAVNVSEYPAFLLLGLTSAVIAWVLLRWINAVEVGMAKLPAPDWARPAIGGFAVGLIALAFPQALGVGYEATDGALNAAFPLALLLALIVAKMAATAFTLGSGFAGGIFSPALFVGAMTGGAFGMIAGQVFPDLASNSGLYAMVGMGAVAAPVLGAPISTILMVFELTGDYSMTIASMIAVSVASVTLVHIFGGKSFFAWQLERRGLDLGGGRARQVLAAIRARDLMSDDFHTVAEHTTIDKVRSKLMEAPENHIFVVDTAERLIGSLSFTDIKDVAFESGLDHLINARDAARPNPAWIGADENLERALAMMDTSGLAYVPVVDAETTMRVIGILHHRRLLAEYNKALINEHAEEHGHVRRDD